jgi:hypothetical protein
MGKDKDKKHHSTGVYDENGNNEVMNIPSISSLHNEKNIKKKQVLNRDNFCKSTRIRLHN